MLARSDDSCLQAPLSNWFAGPVDAQMPEAPNIARKLCSGAGMSHGAPTPQRQSSRLRHQRLVSERRRGSLMAGTIRCFRYRSGGAGLLLCCSISASAKRRSAALVECESARIRRARN